MFRAKSYLGLKLQTFTYFVYIESCSVSRRLGSWYQSKVSVGENVRYEFTERREDVLDKIS